MLTDTVQWIVALCVGVTVVWLNSWSQFDEPSYDTQTEALKPYKPRFTTYRTSYIRAKLSYISAFLALFLAFVFVPDLFFVLFPDSKSLNSSPMILPALIAVTLVAFTRTPVSKDLERRLRSFFHEIANIPEGVRKTISQIRRSDYLPHDDNLNVQTARLDFANGGKHFDRGLLAHLLRDDLITKLWHSIGTLLFSLSPDNRAMVDINSSFLEIYKQELSSIYTKHNDLSKLVRHRIDEIASNPASLRPPLVMDSDTLLQNELETLQERLYVFIACAVRSSVKTETEASNVLRQLGFVRAQPFRLRGNIRTTILMIIQLSSIGILILSVFTAFLTSAFIDSVLTPLGSDWTGAFLIPTSIPQTYAWTWTTAIFYGITMLATIGVREARISQRKWSDLNAEHRQRPVEHYAGPALIGTTVGSATLVLVAAVDGPGFELSIKGLSEIQEGLRLALPWFPLAGAMSLICLWLVDVDLKELDTRVAILSAVGGCFMAIIGVCTAFYSVKTTAVLFAAQHQLTINDMVQDTILKVSIFIAVQIGIITTLLCAVVQISHFFISKAQSLCGNALTMATFRGTPFTIKLDRGGSAQFESAGCANAATSPRNGRWMRFPEGTVVRWDERTSGIRDTTIGIFTCSEGDLVYEEYDGDIAGDAMIVAHLDRRAIYDPAAV
jgi:hypothetical protein